MKKVVYITGTRAEYGVMKGLLHKMRQSGAFDVSIIITGMHLSATHGSTATEVRQSGIRIAGEVDAHIEDATNAGMAKSLGYEIVGITDVLIHERPNLVMVAGDRDEALAGAIIAAHLHIPAAHISGGDITGGGSIDDRIRHAITKFSDIHFPAGEKSASVVISMGENAEYVFSVGNPGLLPTYDISAEEKARIALKYQLDLDKPILLAVQHPTTSESARSGEYMRATLAALAELGEQTMLIYPNADAGSSEVIGAIEEYAHTSIFHIYKSVERDDFLGLMSITSAIVGNSSAALIEAPSFGLPAVNIGDRQKGRERAGNVIDVPHDQVQIKAAIQKALSKEFRDSCASLKNPYSKDNADEKIIEILKGLDLSSKILKKKGTI